MSRKIVIVRHGERVDFTFGEEWITRCFNSSGGYSKNNLNMPDLIPKREGFPRTFLRDCPLTQVGNYQAHLVGKGFKAEKVFPKLENFEVIVSPALRSIETARSILDGMGLAGEKAPSIKVEPCLFEWTGWYPESRPDWLSTKELLDFGFKIDEKYEPFKLVEQIKVDESVEEYYNRTFELVKHLLPLSAGKDLLLVAHGATLDTATRQLCGNPARVMWEMMSVLRGVPYCGVAIAEENDGAWSVSAPPRSLVLRHSSINDFDASIAFSAQLSQNTVTKV